MKIGIIASDLSHRHGWAHYSYSLIQALCKQGHSLTVITARNCPDVPDVEVHRLLPSLVPAERFSLFRMMRQYPAVNRILADCDVIHVTVEPYALLGSWVAGERPLFITGHGSYVHLPERRMFPINQMYERAFMRSTLVCVSHYTARIARNVLPEIRTVVLPNGVDIDRFESLPELDEPKLGPTIVSTGGIKQRKGTLELVRAVNVLRERIPDIQCQIIGTMDESSGYVREVRAEIEKLNLQGQVRLHGHLPEEKLLAWYGAADVFVLPSINAGWKFEGFGLATFEASAAGLPVIGTTNCGAEDAIEQGITGLLVSQNEIANVLPEAIYDILTNPERATQMGLAGREKVRNQTWDIVAAKLVEFYNGAV